MDPTAEVNRFVLPIHEPQFVGLTTYDAKDPDTAFPPITSPMHPRAHPTSSSSCSTTSGSARASAFGGAINTPTAERLAGGGLTLNRFHTTALCGPTRAALLTGRNHHTVGMGTITERRPRRPATPRSGRSRPRRWRDPEAERLSHRPVRQVPRGPGLEDQPGGPVRPVAHGERLRHFYGFIAGETDQYDPALYEGTTPVEPPITPAEGYHSPTT